MEDLFNLCTDRLMSLSELVEDPLFRKIPKDKIDYYIDNSIKLGKEKAKTIEKYHRGSSLKDICKSYGISINIYDKNYKIMNTSYRAEIYYDKSEINILKPSILIMNEVLGNSFTQEEIEDIHIAHEFYHFLEYKDGKDTADLLLPVTNMKIGKFIRKSKVIKTCEIAAHAFCKEYLHLPFHPKALDFIYLINKGDISLEDFKTYLQDIINI